jgi:hypothetical protein
MRSLIFYPSSTSLGELKETTFFFLRCVPNEHRGVEHMSGRSQYVNKAKACLDAEEEALEFNERVELLELGQCFILLVEHVARCEEHGTYRRVEQRAITRH